MNMFTADTFAASVNTLADAIKLAAQGRSKLAATVKALASQAYADSDKQTEFAEFLSALKAQVVAQRTSYKKYLCSNGRADEVDGFEKSHKDAFTYAVKVAGTAAGCKFAYIKKSDSYKVEELALKGEGEGTTANGKDENSASQSADIVSAAAAAPVVTKAMRIEAAKGFFAKFIADGGSMAELTETLANFAAELAASKAAADMAATANEPKAPEILENKLADVMREKGAKVAPARRKRKTA